MHGISSHYICRLKIFSDLFLAEGPLRQKWNKVSVFSRICSAEQSNLFTTDTVLSFGLQNHPCENFNVLRNLTYLKKSCKFYKRTCYTNTDYNKYIRKRCLYRYLKSGQNAGLLGVRWIASRAWHTAEAFCFRVKSVTDTNHSTHLACS